MRHAAASAVFIGTLAVGLLGSGLLAPEAKAEYFCSPGFAPISGGRCIATASRSEINLYLNDPVYDEAPRVVRRHHRRHHVRVRY